MELKPNITVESVVKNYADMVYRLAYAQLRSKSDADDVFQEVFLRYFQKAPSFENEDHRKAWLIRVTINCSKKHFSSAWLRRAVPLEDRYTFSMPEESGLEDSLRKLKPRYRSVIHLYYYEGYSVSEISTILKIKESTVRTQLTRARAKLLEMMR